MGEHLEFSRILWSFRFLGPLRTNRLFQSLLRLCDVRALRLRWIIWPFRFRVWTTYQRSQSCVLL